MGIIARSEAAVEQDEWQIALRHGYQDVFELLNDLDISPQSLAIDIDSQFPLRVPRSFTKLIEKGNVHDPILLQVLPLLDETRGVSGFSTDPLQESQFNPLPGLIHKYHGRVLVTLATSCAINCRYCFRRHFDYNSNRMSKTDRAALLNYINQETSISEVILSGGDPLLVNDSVLEEFIANVESIPHVRRLRIHSRLPVVIPSRMTRRLGTRLQQSRLDVSLVLHINHANEIGCDLVSVVQQWKYMGITVLNQSVLLKKVNDSLIALLELSNALFRAGILPYYLHVLDKVHGAAHFHVDDLCALALHKQLMEQLPGYLVPRLVRENAGDRHKTPLVGQPA